MAAGRQAGKSSACLNELLKRAWETPNTNYWFMSPTFDQAKIQYRKMVGMLWGCSGLVLKKNETELRVKLINNSEIAFKSGEVLHNLRGSTLHGVVVDEVREQSPDLWALVLRPMLTTTNGWAAFVSTPNGYDAFFDLAERAQDPKETDWEFLHAPSTCNPLFTMEEFNKLKTEMSEAQFAQEILAEFRDLTAGKAYINYGTHNNSEFSPFSNENKLIVPYLPIIIGLDFNVNPMCWVLAQHKGGAYYFFDEIFVRNTNTQECVEILINKIKGHESSIWIIGDAAGNARNTKATETDYAIICNALTRNGIKWENRTPKSNPPVRDRVNLVNSKLRSADGGVSLFINPKTCPILKKDFDRVCWKQGAANAMLDKSSSMSDLTHMSDAAGYPISVLTPLHIDGSVGVMRIIRA